LLKWLLKKKTPRDGCGEEQILANIDNINYHMIHPSDIMIYIDPSKENLKWAQIPLSNCVVMKTTKQ